MKSKNRPCLVAVIVSMLGCWLIASSPAAPAMLTEKVAVVIGNSLYGGSEDVSGEKDAQGMKDSLSRLGFRVLKPVLNAHLKEMQDSLKDLRSEIAHASVVIFFYSGHAFQGVDGKNYLLPIGGSYKPSSSISLDEVQQAMIGAPEVSVKLIILDACRKRKNLPPNIPAGLAEPSQPPTRMVFAFGASFGGVAVSSSPNERSPYTIALLSHLQEPGLEIRDLLARVSGEIRYLSGGRQVPIAIGIDRLKEAFFLKAPVTVQANVVAADDDLLVILHGEVVMAASKKPLEVITLKAGDNFLRLMVANGKTFNNNHDWSLAEGWKYEFHIDSSDGKPILKIDEPGEETPFKDGPHHGKVFEVARVNLFVASDPDLGAPAVLVRDLDTETWKHEGPVHARNQAILFEKSLTELQIDLREIIADVLHIGTDFISQALLELALELVRSGKLFGESVADPSKTFVLVLGNESIRDFVGFCMIDRVGDRRDDLRASLSAVLARNDKPFETFDRNLVACIRKEAGNRGIPNPADILVWTAVDDKSKP